MCVYIKSIVWKGGLGPLDFENFSKNSCFRSFEWEKANHHFWPPYKNLGKIPLWPPLGKNPSDAHDQ